MSSLVVIETKKKIALNFVFAYFFFAAEFERPDPDPGKKKFFFGT